MPSSLSALNFLRSWTTVFSHHNAIRTNSLAIRASYNPAMHFPGMRFGEFRDSLNFDDPPKGVSPLLVALWWDGKGNWTKAHEIAQKIESPDAAWVHAYLHRKQGDQGNAGYWYGRAGKPHSMAALDAEWEEMARAFLEQ